MIHEILPVGALQCNCSIFGDEASGEAIVIDPGDEIGRITAILDKHRLRVKAIIITHAHIDHIGGAQKLKALTGAPVYMNFERSGAVRSHRYAGPLAGRGHAREDRHRRERARRRRA